MKRDWHLAKRCYDLAAETNADAKIPVALALFKLQFMFQVENLRNVSMQTRREILSRQVTWIVEKGNGRRLGNLYLLEEKTLLKDKWVIGT